MGLEPFPFVLDELQPIRPTVKRAFGFTYVYLDDTLLCCLRNSEKKPFSSRRPMQGQVVALSRTGYRLPTGDERNLAVYYHGTH